MIDDVTFLPSPLFLVSFFALCYLSSLFFSLDRLLSQLLREVVILRKLNIALKTHNSRSSLSLSLSLISFVFLSFSTESVRSSPLLYHYIHIYFPLSLFLFSSLDTISLDLLPLVIPALSRSSS